LPRDFFICLTTRQIACIIVLLSDAPKFALLTIKKFHLLGGCGKNIHFVKFVFSPGMLDWLHIRTAAFFV